jgi:L-rhamnose mutarotase
MSEKIAFRMQLYPDQAEEYKRRHDEIWPELSQLLTEAGVSDYSIHLDEETNALFAVLWRTDNHTMDDLPKNEVVRRWWDYMADVMETEPDNTPKIWELRTVFHME